MSTLNSSLIYNKEMDTRQQIKHMLINADMTMTELCKRMSKRLGKEYSMHNLSGKLRRDTIKYCEIKEIFDILGFEVTARKKSDR